MALLFIIHFTFINFILIQFKKNVLTSNYTIEVSYLFFAVKTQERDSCFPDWR